MKYPETIREEIIDEIHGVKVEDPYRWLENLEDEEVQQWLDNQHDYMEKIMESIPNRKASLDRIKELLSLGDITLPTQKAGMVFFSKRKTESQYVFYVQKSPKKKPEVLIDPNTLKDNGPIALDWYNVSPKGTYIAYGLSKDGDEWSTLHIMNIKTKELLDERIPRTRNCQIAWLADESGFYYTRFPEPGSVPEGQENYNSHIFFHNIGSDWHDDPKIFGEGRKQTNHYSVQISDDGKYLLISINKYTKNDLYLMNLEKNYALIEVIVGEDYLTSATMQNDEIWFVTNRNASKKAVLKATLAEPSVDKWITVIPELENTIETVHISKEKIFVSVMENAANKFLIYSTEGKMLGEMNIPKYSSIFSLPRARITYVKDDGFYFRLVSFFHPATVYYYNIEKDELSIFGEIKPPIDPKDYEVKQVWYPSKDGTKVSMFLAYKRGLDLDGKNPVILCGYGGFNIPVKPPYISNSRFFWMEKGGIVAVANLRGGSEYGEDWHRDGMLEKKQNVFDDYIFAAKWLIENKYTSAANLAAYGRSNGGLLTGAAITQAPELFGAIYVGVPLLDMIRYHLFRIARYWIPEYGSSENSEQFDYIYKYSPYHNVKKGTAYPATYLVAGASDGRVDPNHAMKMAALLQWATGSEEPVALFVEKQAGHGMGKPLEQIAKADTDLYTFLGWKTGLQM
ncbi:MAG: prolyl oligopeptidase family serine peptidase [Candidatus Heimdallarchaeota archaeon]